ALRVAAMMTELGVERAISGLQCRNEGDHPSAGHENALERFQSADIVSDVLQHVDAKHGVESQARELGSVALFEMADAKREPRMTSYRFLDTRRAIQIGFDSHDEFRDVNQPARNGADPRADLQYPRPDELSNQPEHMVHVPAGFLHGLEVVRSVAVLCLGVSAVGGEKTRDYSYHVIT